MVKRSSIERIFIIIGYYGCGAANQATVQALAASCVTGCTVPRKPFRRPRWPSTRSNISSAYFRQVAMAGPEK